MNFSVLISVYKNENSLFLDNALRSVIKDQTVLPSEVVLVRDGELTDDLNGIIDKWRESHDQFKVVGYPINRGLGFALQYGLKHCTNDVVMRMDGDDICRRDRFEKQLEAMASQSLVLCGGQIEEFNTRVGDLNRLRVVPLRPDKYDYEKRNPFNHMSVAFRKSFIEKVGGYEDVPGYEDYFLWLKLLAADFPCYNLPEVLVDARVGNNLMARRRGVDLFQKELNFQRKALDIGIWGRRVFYINVLRRALPRLLPPILMTVVYKKLRR